MQFAPGVFTKVKTKRVFFYEIKKSTRTGGGCPPSGGGCCGA
jgi:hypothetical protein